MVVNDNALVDIGTVGLVDDDARGWVGWVVGNIVVHEGDDAVGRAMEFQHSEGRHEACVRTEMNDLTAPRGFREHASLGMSGRYQPICKIEIAMK